MTHDRRSVALGSIPNGVSSVFSVGLPMPRSNSMRTRGLTPTAASRLERSSVPERREVRTDPRFDGRADPVVQAHRAEPIEKRPLLHEAACDRRAREAKVLLASRDVLRQQQVVHLETEPDALRVVAERLVKRRALPDAAVDEVGALGQILRVDVGLVGNGERTGGLGNCPRMA
jgi:hypothetical protein